MKRPTWYVLVAVLITLLAANGSAVGQTPPTPEVTYNVRMPSPAITSELVHLVQDFAPDAATPVHTHGGQGLALVLEGELTQRMEGQSDKVYKTGETFVEMPGEYFAVANLSNASARLSVAFLLPKGATLTTPQQLGTPTIMPRTGATGASAHVWLLALGGLGVLAGLSVALRHLQTQR